LEQTSLLHANERDGGTRILELAADQALSLSLSGSSLKIAGIETRLSPGSIIKVVPDQPGSELRIESIKRWGAKGASVPRYHGNLYVITLGGVLRIVLETELDTYLKGVLQSEIPPSYELEAIKSQAVTARTYALRPRIDHTKDQCNVCDSYLCCQYFGGLVSINARHEQAIDATKSQVLTYQSEPILALFSSCAGGHTEDYQNCFSDPVTGEFPPKALPYLKGVPEGKLPAGFSPPAASENALRSLWALEHPDTADAWSPQFRWSVSFKADDLEGHMHHVVSELQNDPTVAPFIKPPSSNTFGHIKSFSIMKRGVAGTAVELLISTSTGDWHIEKELVIRSCFKCPSIKLARLKSARVFFDHTYDRLGLLANVTVHGLGFGHGVGLQQTGAQGHAKRGLDYRKILSHYFPGTQIETL
jgi:SpoIID/LytB domain protein